MFMRAGGRIALLDDYGTGDALREPLRHPPRATARTALGDAPRQPVVRDRRTGERSPGRARRLARGDQPRDGAGAPGLSPLLVIHGDGEPDVLLAVAGAVGQGRLLAVGDASVGINAMLRYPGNRELCPGLLRYSLEDDAWGKRGGKLYVLANDFETTGSLRRPTRASERAPPPRAGPSSRDSRCSGAKACRRRAAYVAGDRHRAPRHRVDGRAGGKTHRPVVPRFARRDPGRRAGGHRRPRGRGRGPRRLAPARAARAEERPRGGPHHPARTRRGCPPPDALVAKVRSAGLLGAEDAEDLVRACSRPSPGSRAPPRRAAARRRAHARRRDRGDRGAGARAARRGRRRRAR